MKKLNKIKQIRSRKAPKTQKGRFKARNKGRKGKHTRPPENIAPLSHLIGLWGI